MTEDEYIKNAVKRTRRSNGGGQPNNMIGNRGNKKKNKINAENIKYGYELMWHSRHLYFFIVRFMIFLYQSSIEVEELLFLLSFFRIKMILILVVLYFQKIGPNRSLLPKTR